MKKLNFKVIGLVLTCFFALSCKKAVTLQPAINLKVLAANKSYPTLTGNTYYVSPTGNDGNNGTSTSTPWKTIAKVNSGSFNPGDQVLFQGGQTFAGNLVPPSSGSTSQYIRFASYGTGLATINAGTGCGVYVHDKSNVWIDSLVVTGGWNESSQSGNTSYGILYYNDLNGTTKLGNAYVSHCNISGFYDEGINFYGYTGDGSQSGYSLINASYNTVHDNGLGGIESNGPYPPASGSTSYAFTSAYVGYNTVYNNYGLKAGNGNHTGDGIVFSDCAGGTIEHNVAYNNGWYNSNSGGGPAAIWCWDCTGITLQYNEAYGNGSGTSIDGDGFDLDGGATYCTMQYNYSHGNKGAGFLVWEFGDARGTNSHNTIRYNISQNDGTNNGYSSLHVGGGCQNNLFYNNTLYNVNGSCVSIQNGPGNNCYNNIFYCAKSGTNIASSSSSSTLFLNNEYYNSAGAFSVSFNGTTYTSLSSLQASGAGEVLNGSDYGYNVNPSLNNPGNGGTIGNYNPNTLTNYQLNSGSSMIDNGFNLTTLGFSVGSLDFNGSSIPYGSGYDIGACESHSGTGNGIISGATYQLVSGVNNTSVLDVNGAGTANGTIVQLWANNNAINQKWVVTSVGGGYYSLAPAYLTGSMLDVSGAGTANGTQVQIWQSNGGSNQKWLITNVGGGYYTLAPGNAPGSCLDVNGSGTANGTKVQIWQSGGGSNQKWEFIKQ